ncbi:AAEL009122-PA [Aedes aegypti]|uniref:AAEL009122-PA n=2 Tax=Aedes aegypti TaxID=7159 RepID=A0A1S4FLD8_AEDAE|nr:cytochrome P450 6A1 [Aedes aegypti]EAT39035.1 AAEL009122-PA [Aedes aegypti]
MWIYLLLPILTLSFLLIRRRFSYWQRQGVPFIPARFPVGSFDGVGVRNHPSQLLAKFYRQMKGLHPFVGVYYFLQPVVVVLDLDFAKTILIRDFQYFHDRGLYYNEKDDPISGNLLHLEGSRWTNQRKKLIPTFSSGKLRMMCPTILKVADNLKVSFERYVAERDEIEIKDILARFSTDVIASCAFGLDCSSLLEADDEFRRMGTKVFDISGWKLLKLFFVFAFGNVARRCHMKLIDEDISQFFFKVVRETIDFRKKNHVHRKDFLNLLIQLKDNGELEGSNEKLGTLTLNEVVAHSFVFFLGGFETASTTMSYCLYELSLNEEVQERARQCVKAAIHKYGDLNYDALLDMPYLEQCINETLRKYPPSTIYRIVTQNYHVPDSSIVFPKGMSVMIPVYAIHHDPEFWPSPELYDPDRFAPEECVSRNPLTFIPFGEGPRMCVAARLGVLQTKIGLATLLMNFRFSRCKNSTEPLQYSPKHFILTPVGGLKMRVEKIQ